MISWLEAGETQGTQKGARSVQVGEERQGLQWGCRPIRITDHNRRFNVGCGLCSLVNASNAPKSSSLSHGRLWSHPVLQIEVQRGRKKPLAPEMTVPCVLGASIPRVTV